MLSESYFPYILFLEGSNFMLQDIEVMRPDGSSYTLHYDTGILNRLDRLTAANYGMKINTNLCKNKFVFAIIGQSCCKLHLSIHRGMVDIGQTKI